MKRFKHIIIRVIPALAMLYLIYFGYQHWQKPISENTVAKTDNKKTKKDRYSKKNSSARKAKTQFIALEKKEFQINLTTQGVLEAIEVTDISSQVNGVVEYISPKFATGSFINKGEVLVRLSTEDRESAIVTAEAALARSEVALKQEIARGKQVVRNWKDLGYTDKPNELVLRKPQMREEEANIKSAQTNLLIAERNLERCVIKAPFSGVIRSRDIGLGMLINSGRSLGVLLGTNYAEIRLPLNHIQVKELHKNENAQAEIILKNALDPESDISWKGALVRQEGEWDLNSRELFYIARVDDPFNLKNTHAQPLAFNLPLMAYIPATKLPAVYEIDREFVIGFNEIVGIIDRKVQRMKFTPLWETKESIIIDSDEIAEGTLLATSRLEYATNGTEVILLDTDGEVLENSAPDERVSRKNKK